MKHSARKVISIVLVMAMVVTICPQMQLIDISAAGGNEPYCISEGRPVYVSSGKNEEMAVDGDFSTRWESAHENKTEWMYVDLGKKADIDHIYLDWENAYAKSYTIQLSDDELNWRDVYTKGNAAPGEDESREPSAMSVDYKVLDNLAPSGARIIQGSWSAVDNATYKVCINNENTVATAPDGYKFNSHGPNNGQIALTPGEYTLIVIALDKNTKAEVGRGTRKIVVPEVGEIVTEEPTSPGETKPVVDVKKQTIDLKKYVPNAADRQARYVRIYMTEKQLPAYGYSLYEFQVYGENGIIERPEDYGTNLAKGKTVKSSGIRDEWWMYDENGVLRPDAAKNVQAENAVDGNTKTSFTSYQGDDQWIYVDLGQEYTLGRVLVNWNNDAGKIYDVDVSSDAKNWKTVHRVLKGYSDMNDTFTCYQEKVRYVRVFGYTKVESGSGFGINELEVYAYREGDSKVNETIPELPVRQIVNNANGKGSYVSGEMYNEKNKLPTFINEETIKTPIDSNSWWSSAMVKPFSNLLCVTPLKAKFSTKGLGVLLATSGWVGTRTWKDLGTDQSSETGIDFYVSPDGCNTSQAYDRVEEYGDYSVQLGLMDNKGVQMKTTFVKGSPYLFNEFCDNTTAYLNSSTITEIFDGNGNAILKNAGEEIVTDHIGFKSFDDENTKAKNDGAYYCVNVPAGTTFKAMVAGSKYTIKITFPSKTQNYMSIAAMPKKSDIDTYYKHGYAFVTDTHVDYTYSQNTSKIVTTYDVTTKVMRTGFSNVTMQAMFPHQWKRSNDANTPAAVYTSVRGDMKAVWSNSFKTTQQFAGLLPTFAKPQSDMFNSAEMIEYLNAVVASKINTAPVDDAYWEGKNVHPLAISIIMADQLGETEIKEKLLKKLKSIMVDWFTYDGGTDKCYLIYNKDWGTVYYPNSAYGANAAICDHHFTYGYFMYGAAVLATYDKQFLNDYRDMIEILVRDYADPKEPEDDGNMFCKFRAFDQYQGHSWAGGYADSDSGNNQESASEALFSWVGMYLWGEATQNRTYIDAGAYGFTTEMEAVEQYWFDYDETNWLPEYPFEGTGQIYGASMGYGTYFGGQPTYIYGIQWLPISEYLTNYGMNQEKCAKIYAGLEYDTQYAIDIETKLAEERGEVYDPNSYVTPDNGWQHITWPFLSQTDAQRAYNKFKANVTKVQTEDRANTLWFIAAMDQLGYRTNDYVITGNIQGSVYYNKNTDKYTAQVWNPTEKTQTVTIIDSTGKAAGTAKVGSRGLVSFNIDTNKNFTLSQVSTPIMKATSLATGTVTDNVTGEAVFEDTQIVELSCEESGATIYYTTDGTVPTKDSKVYDGKILVSSNSTVKAVAMQNGYIDSAYASTAFVINGDKVESSDNLALGKRVEASSENGGDVAAKAVDGAKDTRWQALANDDEYIQVDLGSVQTVNTVKIIWEAAYASKYQIQVSTDGDNWSTVATENGLVGEIVTTFAATKARYVRMQGLSRGTQYGYSIYEFEVYGALQAAAPVITPVSGTYNNAQTVTMSTSVKGAEIKYTLDGTTPTEDSPTYTQPISVTKSTIVKAVTYRKGMILSDVAESSIVIAGTISLNKTEAKIAIGRTLQLIAMTEQTTTWASSNASVASVDNNGIVTGKTAGQATITVSAANGQKATCQITVTEPVHITSVTLQPSVLEMKNKTSQTLELVINPADTTDDTTAVWSSSDENVLLVNQNGTLTAKNEGTATITAKVGTFTAKCEVTVGPAATVTEMIASGKYNAALGKPASALPSVEEGNAANLTDGNPDGGYAATTFGKAGTYFEIDLGQVYDATGIDRVVTKYKEANDGDTPVKGYQIQYSTNGVDFRTVKTVNGAEAKEAWIANNLFDVQTVEADGAVRYVRIVYPDSYTWGIQVREIAVLSTEQNLKVIEVETCDNPADFTVSSDNFCEITYTITAGEGQEDYKYVVFLNGMKVADRVDAGTYTIKDVEAGTYKVQVLSYYDGKTSKGITREVTVDDGSLKNYVDTPRNLSRGCTVTVDAIESVQEEGSKNPATLVDGKISKQTPDVVEMTWGSKTGTITLDLEKNVAKENINEVLIAFKEDKTFATKYTVEFSKDGTNYETVITANKSVYKDVFEDKFDPSTYSKDTVRYVRINLLDGNVNWGYQISEVAVMGGTEFMPVEPEGLVVTSPSYNMIRVTWTGEDNGQTYWVYIDGNLKDMDVAAGTYSYAGIDAGEHTVKVTSKLNGIESKGVTANVTVTEAPATTPEVTTQAPTKPGEVTTPDETTSNTGEVTTPDVTTKPGEVTTSDETTKPGEVTTPDVTTKPGEVTTPDETTSNTGEVTTPDETTSNIGEVTTPDVTTKPGEVTTPNETTSNTGTTAKPQETTTKQDVKPTAQINIAKTKVKKAVKKAAAKTAKISLKKIKGVKGYQVKVSSTKKFKAKKTITKNVKKVKFTLKLKKLKKSRKLYVKARAYKLVGKTKHFGKWSNKKKIKIKK